MCLVQTIFEHPNLAGGFRQFAAQYGDLLLQDVGERLKSWARAQDTVARLGGDEFVIVLNDIDDIPDAAELCRRLVEQYRAAKKTWAGDISAGLAEANRGDFASEEEVAAVISRFAERR